MLESISNVLQRIGDFFVSAWDIISNFFEEIAYIVRSLNNIVSRIPSLFGFLPASVLALLVAIITIIIAFRVIGRD